MAKRFDWRALASGIVTGASDSDPSAVVTSTQVGATTGLTCAWLFPLTTIALVFLDRMAIRIGSERQLGLALLLRNQLGRPVAIALCAAFVAVNAFTLGADVSGASAVLTDLSGLPKLASIGLVTIIPAAMVLGGTFHQLRRGLLALTPLYLLYIVAAIASKPSLPHEFGDLAPSFDGDATTLLSIAGIFGAVLTPYVFFWQMEDSTQLVRRFGAAPARAGSAVGMVLVNVVLLAVLVTSAATLHRSGGGSGLQLETLRQAGDALRPALGDAAFACFSIAVLASALIAVPVIATVCAYVICQLAGWRYGPNWPFAAARKFYSIILIALACGAAFALAGINPVTPLFWAQVANGVLLPIVAISLLIEGRRLGNTERSITD